MFGTQGGSQKTNKTNSRNPLETLKNFDNPDNWWEKADRAQIGKEMPKTETKKPLPQRKEFSVFSYQRYHETEVVRRQIKELTEVVRKEIENLKMANRALVEDLKDVQKLTLNSLPENMGVYHIRFLEVIISLLRSLRAKVGESRTWMQALVSKKKKRGSLFAARSKKSGTQYSMSQELQSARSVQ